MREIVHLQAGQCGNQIGAKVGLTFFLLLKFYFRNIDFVKYFLKGGHIEKSSTCKIDFYITFP